MSVGTQIKLRRKQKKITARDLAEAVGVTPGMISHYELDRTKEIPDEMLKKISEVLDCSVDDLVQGDPRYDSSSVVAIDQSEDLEDRFYAEKLVQFYYRLPTEAKTIVNQFLSAIDS